jgi:hypothetical protein
MPNPRAQSPLTLDKAVSDLQSFAQPAQAMGDMLASTLRGSVAATAGLPGDIRELIDLFGPEAVERVLGKRVMPTTQDMNKMLPPAVPTNAPASRQHTANVYGSLGEFLPLPGSGAAAKAAGYGLGRAAGAGTRAAGQAISDAMIHQTGPLASGPLSALAPRMAMTNVVPNSAGKSLMDKAPQAEALRLAQERAAELSQSANPETRMLQQGYEPDWYHGSTGDIKKFNQNLLGESTGAKSAEKGFFFARDPSTPPAHMLEHDPESLALLEKIGATIPPKPTMKGHGAETASSYAGAGGSREYKEAMRQAKSAEKSKNWGDYEKYMMKAEDAVTEDMRYRQGLVAQHGDARDDMLEKIKNAWYGPQNADRFKNMSQSDYEAHDRLFNELMPYGWYTSPLYDKPQFKNLIDKISSVTGEKHSKEAIDAINKYRSVHNERMAADVESGANVLPVALRYKNPMYHDFEGKSYREQTYSDLVDEAKRKGHDALILKNTFDPGGSGGNAKMVDVGVVFDPDQIRSRFAAFDPLRKTAATAAAAGLAAPDLLAEENKANGGEVEMNAGGTPRYPTEQEREAMRKLRESFLPAAKDAERLKRLRDSMERSEQKRVSISDNPDTMMLELGEVHMGKGGAAKEGVEGLLKLVRAPAKKKEEIEAIAQRIAPQMTGEYVRGKKGAKTVAGKTQKQFEREKTLEHDIRPTAGERPPVNPVDIESLKGNVMMGISGDPTITGQTLHGVAGRELRSPVPQHGGPLYGLGHDNDSFWASNLGAAQGVQNRARELGGLYQAPVVGNYVKMGPDSYSYAQHFADANLQNIRPENMTKAQIEGFNKLVRKGSAKSGPRPSWPGIENPDEAYLHMVVDPELRKHFGNLMQMPLVTEKFGLPSGLDVAHAVTEPDLRNMEIGVTGKSMGLMRPDVTDLKLSEHPTYSHDIPGQFIGGLKYPTPYELTFPDTLKSVRENPKQASQEFGSFKMVGPSQIIDPQLIDEIKQYEEFIKKYTGKKKGGEVHMADGGITGDDLIIEERPL